MPSRKNRRLVAYESTLEADCFTLFEFDPNIRSYEEQPIRIEYTDRSGRSRRYTPDALVTYRTDIEPAHRRRPLLCEIKPRESFVGRWREWREPLRAGRAYAEQRGWDFKVLTEREIRTPYLVNARFLLPYQQSPAEATREQILHDVLYELRQCDVETLLLAACHDRWNRAELLPALWRMVAWGDVGCNLDEPLTMRSLVWVMDPDVPRRAR